MIDNGTVPLTALLDQPPAAVKVYCAIARYANPEGQAYPSMDRIAEDTGIARRSVFRHIGALVTAGMVSRDVRVTADGQTTSLLTLTVPPVAHPRVTSGTQKELPPTEVVTSSEVVVTSGATDGTPPSTNGTPPFPELPFKRSGIPVTPNWLTCWAEVCSIANELDPMEHLTMYLAKKRKAGKVAAPDDWIVWFCEDQRRARHVEPEPERPARQWWMVEGDY